MELDLTIFAGAAVSGIPLLFVVFGIVQYAKTFKRDDGSQLLTGNGLLIVSMVVGLVVGALFMLSQNPPPTSTDPYAWFLYLFGLIVYGLALGLLAALFWDGLRGAVEKLRPTPVGSDRN